MTFILGLVVISIWGVFIYRLFQEDNKETQLSEKLPELVKSKLLLERREEYKIKDYEKDPFLGKPKPKRVVRAVPKTPAPSLTWPQLNYLGQLTSNKGERHLFSVNQKTIVWEIGKEYEGMRLEKKRNGLLVRYHNETKTFLNTVTREK